MTQPRMSGRFKPGRIVGQGALLFSGFAVSQGLSFLRNALIGHWLSKGDFGIAATIALALQLLDTLSDLGADRLIIQASDGDDPGMVATAHTTLVLRGMLSAAMLYASSDAIAGYFRIPEAANAFALAALVPLLKGLMHLDPRRAQRDLDNRAFLAVEVLPQLAAVALLAPLIRIAGSYEAVVWVALVQAFSTLIASHVFAKRRYALSLDRAHLHRLMAFGWPIWLSAFPLLAVYQADRIIVGRLYGMEILAGYTAAFMLTMVPGQIAAKVGNALMLPLLSPVKGDAAAFSVRCTIMAEATALVASVYAIFFLVAGADVLPLAFGPQYEGLGAVLSLLALMWAVRMVQAVPGIALMAIGRTQPLLWAGVIRAMSLTLVALAAVVGGGVVGVAAAGIVGEVASLVYIARAARAADPGLMRAMLTRTAFIFPCAAAAGVLSFAIPEHHGLVITASAAMLVSSAASMVGLAAMPRLRGFVEDMLRRRTDRRRSAAVDGARTEITSAPGLDAAAAIPGARPLPLG